MAKEFHFLNFIGFGRIEGDGFDGGFRAGPIKGNGKEGVPFGSEAEIVAIRRARRGLAATLAAAEDKATTI